MHIVRCTKATVIQSIQSFIHRNGVREVKRLNNCRAQIKLWLYATQYSMLLIIGIFPHHKYCFFMEQQQKLAIVGTQKFPHGCVFMWIVQKRQNVNRIRREFGERELKTVYINIDIHSRWLCFLPVLSSCLFIIFTVVHWIGRVVLWKSVCDTFYAHSKIVHTADEIIEDGI